MSGEAIGRAVKATRIADLLSEVGARVPALNALTLERASEDERAAYGRAAECRNPPSARTWEIVIAILRDRERRALSRRSVPVNEVVASVPGVST